VCVDGQGRRLDVAHGLDVGVGLLALGAEVHPIEVADRGDIAEGGASADRFVDARRPARASGSGRYFSARQRGRAWGGNVGVPIAAQGLDAADLILESAASSGSSGGAGVAGAVGLGPAMTVLRTLFGRGREWP
jgi:hypothetical protein